MQGGCGKDDIAGVHGNTIPSGVGIGRERAQFRGRGRVGKDCHEIRVKKNNNCGPLRDCGHGRDEREGTIRGREGTFSEISNEYNFRPCKLAISKLCKWDDFGAPEPTGANGLLIKSCLWVTAQGLWLRRLQHGLMKGKEGEGVI